MKAVVRKLEPTPAVQGAGMSSDVYEGSVNAALLATPGLYHELSERLHADDFASAAHAALFTAIGRIETGEHPVSGVVSADPMTLMALPEVARYFALADLKAMAANAPDTPTAHSHAALVAEAARTRAMQSSVKEAHSVAHDSTLSFEERAQKIESIVDRVADAREKRTGSLFSFVSAEAERLIEYGENPDSRPSGIKTGHEDFDDLTCGLHPGELIILAGRPAMGKTALAFDWAYNIACNGHRVFAASLEMSGQELARRMISKVSGLTSQRLRSMALREDDWDRLSGAVEVLAAIEQNFTVSDDPCLTTSSLRSQLIRMKREGPLGLVVIDYLQLMMAAKARSKRQEEISDISRELKVVAKELEVPIVALSQLSRECEKRVDKRPVISDLRESGSIEQDADMVAMIYRDEVYNPDTEDIGIAELLLRKQRAGPIGDVRLRFVGATTSFESLARQPA